MSFKDVVHDFDSLCSAIGRHSLDRSGEEIVRPAIVGMAGIPGSGKSTLAARLKKHFCESGYSTQMIPMDGYHLPKSQLSPEQRLRRGAIDTFDAAKFRSKLFELRETGSGAFASFDHRLGDPIDDAIVIDQATKLVIVEGLYLFMPLWSLNSCFDLSIAIQCDLETAMTRVTQRHLDCGLAETWLAAHNRAQENDRRNAQFILDSHCLEQADILYIDISITVASASHR
jgi:pantothenate kinase